jgi:hypothetical protein
MFGLLKKAVKAAIFLGMSVLERIPPLWRPAWWILRRLPFGVGERFQWLRAAQLRRRAIKAASAQAISSLSPDNARRAEGLASSFKAAAAQWPLGKRIHD